MQTFEIITRAGRSMDIMDIKGYRKKEFWS